MGFEVYSISNNKANSLVTLSYSLHIFWVATEGIVTAVGTGALLSTQLPELSGDLL